MMTTKKRLGGDVPRDRDASWLRGRKPRPLKSRPKRSRTFKVVDLFCGCGGMTLGLQEAARRTGCDVEVVLAVDNDEAATETFEANFPGARVRTGDINELFSGSPGEPLSETEQKLRDEVGPVDILCLGAPCQGHSDLNNHTRRDDPKNALYFKAARAAEVLRPAVILAENVPNAQRDADAVVVQTIVVLEGLGYEIEARVIDGSSLGLPQRRRRFVLIASAIPELDPGLVLEQLQQREFPERDVRWAIGDLETVDQEDEMDRPSKMSDENQRRTAVLFERDLDDLPDEERPRCHRDFDHSYKSVYGRLRWDVPAQTITTGFTSMGQGRYIHPSCRRTLTPHEAARLQTFPDWFKWPIKKRTKAARMIGNAVPPLLMVRMGTVIFRAILKMRTARSMDGRSAKKKATPVILNRGKRANERRAPTPDKARSGATERVASSRPPLRRRHRTDRGISSPR